VGVAQLPRRRESVSKTNRSRDVVFGDIFNSPFEQ
jgi:hypothetical protein